MYYVVGSFNTIRSYTSVSSSIIDSSLFETTNTLSTSTTPTSNSEEGFDVSIAMFGGIAIGIFLIMMVISMICLCIVIKRTRKPATSVSKDDLDEPHYEAVQLQKDLEIKTETNQCYGIAGRLNNEQLYSAISDEPAINSPATADEEDYI